MKIADLESASGVGRSTIRHYLNLGLLQPPRMEGPKLHLFGEEHLGRLREIRKLRGEGWTLQRIRERLARTRVKRRTPAADGGGQDMRGRIIEHATQLFAEKGYEGVRLSEVARGLGVGKATLYRHFASKQALFVDCVERVRFTLIPKVAREANEQKGTFEEQGERRARAVLEHFASYRTLTHLLGSLAQGGDAELAPKARKELHLMVTNAEPLIRRAIRDKRVRALDPELLAYMLWGALIGAGERLTFDDRYTLDRVLQEYLDFITFGLSGHPAVNRKRP